MEGNKILNANLIDIIFDGRNKTYGAYELRSKYASRLWRALLITASVAILIMVISILSAKFEGPKSNKQIQVKEVEMVDVKQEQPVEPPPPPPPKPPDPPKIEMAKFTPLKW